MVPFFGDYNTTETVNLPFNAFSSDDPSASVTITNLAAGDIEIHKDGAIVQRASDNGVTVSIDFDGVTGNHMAHIDLSDNSDAGFYANGSRYQVRIEGTTIDGATVNAWIGCFSVGCTLRPTTAGRTLDIQSTGEVDANLMMIFSSVLSETSGGLLAAAFKKFFDKATPTGTINSLPDAVPGAANGLFIAGTNAATAITTALTANLIGNITGNLSGSVDSVTNGVTLANGAITDASLAGAMEIVFETDFATNYNTTRNAWVTNAQDFVGTTAADPFSGQIVAASVTTKTGFSLANGSIVAATFGAGAIDAAAIAAGAIDNATFAADVGSTVYASNIIALAVRKAIDNYDGPTNTEMVAAFTEIKGASWASETDTLEAIRDRGDSAWITATSVTVSDKTGFSVSQTGLDAVLSSTTFALAIADAIWEEAIAGHTTGTTFGGKNQKVVPSETIADYRATGFNTVIPDAAGVVATALGDGTVVLHADYDAAKTAAQAGDAMALTESERNSAADAILGRNVSNVEDTATEWTLCSIVLAAMESSVSGTTWTIKKVDGATTFKTKTVATDADADPITSVS